MERRRQSGQIHLFQDCNFSFILFFISGVLSCKHSANQCRWWMALLKFYPQVVGQVSENNGPQENLCATLQRIPPWCRVTLCLIFEGAVCQTLRVKHTHAVIQCLATSSQQLMRTDSVKWNLVGNEFLPRRLSSRLPTFFHPPFPVLRFTPSPSSHPFPLDPSEPSAGCAVDSALSREACPTLRAAPIKGCHVCSPVELP